MRPTPASAQATSTQPIDTPNLNIASIAAAVSTIAAQFAGKDRHVERQAEDAGLHDRVQQHVQGEPDREVEDHADDRGGDRRQCA